jgi:hypothetical protein
VSFVPDDGDRLQSPKLLMSFIKDRQWIMSRKFVILTWKGFGRKWSWPNFKVLSRHSPGCTEETMKNLRIASLIKNDEIKED